MTQPNDYGVVTKVDEAYDFDGWEWGAEIPEDLVARISAQAGQIILQEMGSDAHIWLVETDSVPAIEFSCIEGRAKFTCSFAEIIDTWLLLRGDDAEAKSRILASLEHAIATIRAHD